MKEIVGAFVYQLHGCVHARNFKSGKWKPENPKRLTWGVANEKQGVLDEFELPAMTAFYPQAAFFPPFSGLPAYTPFAGFYPYSEMGVMQFANDGTMSASSRLNTSGVLSDLLPFKGRYMFDPDIEAGGGKTTLVQFLATGLLTLNGAGGTELIWDYAFAFIDKDEALLMAGGRFPRPATLAGRMWRRSGV
jgi:hypothetical protein